VALVIRATQGRAHTNSLPMLGCLPDIWVGLKGDNLPIQPDN